MSDWFLASPTDLLAVVLTALAVYAAIVLFTQMAGLRSFSKMSGFDFATTVAVGSVLASAILTPSPSLLQAVVGLAALYVIQWVVAVARQKSRLASWLVDNEPLLIMTADGILHDNLRRARMTEPDLWAKLREANVLDPAQVRAVVMETTGDVSVLHGPPDGTPLHPHILSSVRDAARAPGIAAGEAEAPPAGPFG